MLSNILPYTLYTDKYVRILQFLLHRFTGISRSRNEELFEADFQRDKKQTNSFRAENFEKFMASEAQSKFTAFCLQKAQVNSCKSVTCSNSHSTTGSVLVLLQ